MLHGNCCYLGEAPILATFLVIGLVAVIGWNRDWLGVRGIGSSESVPIDEPDQEESLASFGLVIPVEDFELAEAKIAMKVIERNAVLIRNRRATELGSDGIQPPPIVGVLRELPSETLRMNLAERGFQFAVVVDRDGVSTLLAQLGLISEHPELEEGPRLVPSDGSATGTMQRDAWETWSGRSEAQSAIEAGVGPLLVPVALIPSEPEPTEPQ